MRRLLVRLGAPLVFLTGLGVLVATPATAAPGFDLDVTEVPGIFRAGAGAERISAVVSTTNDDGCRKVLWSLVLRVEGLRLNQVRIDRIEQNGSFPVRISTDGNTARITDRQVDPGTLCRGRTVTAQYRVAVAGDVTDGRITFRHEAYDPDGRLLAQASVAREIASDRSRPDRADRAERKPSPTVPVDTETEPPTEEPVDPAAEGPGAGGAAGPADQPGAETDQAATAGTSGGGTGLVTIGFVVGGLLLFLGVGLLLRLRQRLLGDDSLGMGAADGLATAPAAGFGRSRARTVPRGGSRGGYRAAAPGRRRR